MTTKTMDKDPIIIDEVIQIHPETTEVKYERTDSQFASVVFHNICETYPTDAHIECRYTVTSDLIPAKSDWVGLYKVGWMSPRDYIYYEWAPIPKEYEIGKDADSSVLFQAHKLPGDDGEFYQFCYVASNYQIRGASTPFQFRKPSANDFVEIEDEETNMLVIRSKTVLLQENLQQAEVQKNKLIEAQESLLKERDEIVGKYQDMKKKAGALDTSNEALKGKLTATEAQIGQLMKEAKDMLLVQEELTRKLEENKKEKERLEETICKLETEIKSLKTAAKKLQTEKDELSGTNIALKEEVEIYKTHFTSSESAANKYVKESEKLQQQLIESDGMVASLRQQLDTAKLELDKLTAQGIQDKDSINELVEKLKNSEDKLSAAEECKRLQQEEILSFQLTQEKLSKLIEQSKSENIGLKEKLCHLEEDFSIRNKCHEDELEQTRKDFLASIQEKEKLQASISGLQHSLEESRQSTGVRDGSMTIMKQSFAQLKERLDKKEKKIQTLEKTIAALERDFLQEKQDMQREIEDLKEKIFMCREEYKLLYIEKSKLQRKAEKTAKKKSKVSRPVSESEVEVEQLQTQAGAAAEPQPEPEPVDIEPLTQELGRQADDLQKELETRQEKKNKYKTLFLKEKANKESLIEKHAEELKEKDDLIDTLKRRIQEIPNTWDMKVRALEKCVNEKEQIIEELNSKLRLASQGNDVNERVTASSLQSVMGPPTESKYPHCVMHPQFQQMSQFTSSYNPYIVYPQQGTYAYPQYPQQTDPQMVLPPLVYPGYDCPRYPAQSNQAKTAIDQQDTTNRERTESQEPAGATADQKDDDDQHFLDSVENTDDPNMPLMPLPAPLCPVVLPSAKTAAVMVNFGLDEPDTCKFEIPDSTENMDTELKVALPSAPPATGEERFYDAEDKLNIHYCDVCQETFPPEMSEQAFEEHQLNHAIGDVCPFCKMWKDEAMTDEHFQYHIENCLARN